MRRQANTKRKSEMDNRDLADHLLEPEYWPAVVRASQHASLLHEIVELSMELDEQTEGSADTDSKLHRLYAGCARIAPWLPVPSRGRAPSYTRTTWDMRALAAIVPPGLDMELDSTVENDGSGYARWQANLHDHINARHVVHPSDLEHNATLSYDGGEYGSAWTPNLALARILLAAYLLAAIQAISGRVLPNGRKQQPAALTA